MTKVLLGSFALLLTLFTMGSFLEAKSVSKKDASSTVTGFMNPHPPY